MLSDAPGRRARVRVYVGLVAIAAAACAALSGCGDTEADGDCVGRVRLDGVLYEPRYDATVAPAAVGEPLGRADLVDCGSVDTAPAVDSVTPRDVRGVSSSVAVVVRSGRWRGLYLVEGLDRSPWPPALRRVLTSDE